MPRTAFTAELAIVKPLAPDPNAIALLEPFSASGVPGNAVLGQELAAIVRPMLADDRISDDWLAALREQPLAVDLVFYFETPFKRRTAVKTKQIGIPIQ